MIVGDCDRKIASCNTITGFFLNRLLNKLIALLLDPRVFVPLSIRVDPYYKR